ncbi:NitT/TauT family transport system permease protein [Natranaerovirga hydrolytica]|uniref:NitT/TauT family transport system permease protein n=1 Tax=Natranaerovirga hydrolytica TaxID=680378 RepID=A0A4R1MJ15_9FIRM|nr:ABC transporter permease subunit [Natranaerovirga hydrolytica]TCK92738.1 NitT/TauT family transport system permease protein [Natranaerovirga hydrolytica]
MKTSILNNKKIKEGFYTLIAVIGLIIIWKIISLIVDKEILIPSPESTYQEMIRIITAPNFLLSVWNTLRRAIIGFVIAMTLGITLGMVGGFSNIVYYLFRPFVLMNKAVPTMAIILLALIWLESEKAPILVGFVVIFPILYENTVQGIRNVDKKLLEMMKIYKISRFNQLRDLYLPSIKSYIKGAMSVAIALNLKIIVAAEVLSQPRLSIGTSFQIERVNLNTAGVFAWAFITVILAGGLEQSLKLIRKDI